jgi:hypothetical protein
MVSVGNVQGLSDLKRFEQVFRCLRIASPALEVGDDRAVVSNDALAAGNMPLGLGSMIMQHDPVHDPAPMFGRLERFEPGQDQPDLVQARNKESPGMPWRLNTGAKAVMSDSWAAASFPYHPTFGNARNS